MRLFVSIVILLGIIFLGITSCTPGSDGLPSKPETVSETAPIAEVPPSKPEPLTETTPIVDVPENTGEEKPVKPSIPESTDTARPVTFPDDVPVISFEFGKQLTVFPNEIILPPGGTTTFIAVIDGQPADVGYTILESNGGSVGADGSYTAPQQTGTYHLNVVSTTDSSLQTDVEVKVYRAGAEDPASMGIHLLQDGWTIETLTPRFPMGSSPFDVAVLPDGRVITIGPDEGKKVFASIDTAGNVQLTDIPSPVNRGGYFEAADDGRVWFWENMAGKLWVSAGGDTVPTLVTDALPVDGYGGSIAVAPDGSEIYICWGGPENRKKLLRYSPGKGLETILDNQQADGLSCVEAACDGTIYVVQNRSFYTLGASNDLNLWMKIDFEVGIMPDSLTSDEDGNLYFSGSGASSDGGAQFNGIYKISPEKKITLYAEFDDIYQPGGMAWNAAGGLLFGAQKLNNNIAVYSPSGVFPLLDSNLYLNLPMALAFTSDGRLLVNYEEVGLYQLDEYYRAHLLNNKLICFGPPSAGMTVLEDNRILYTAAAPDLPRDIMEIDISGNAKSIYEAEGMPAGIDIAPDGRIFFADWARSGIYELNSDGTDTLYKSGIPYPLGLVIDSEYNFWVTAAAEGAVADGNPLVDCIDVPRPRILKIDSSGKVTVVLDVEAARAPNDVYFGYPDIAPDGTLYVSDGNLLYRVREGQTYTLIAVGMNQVSSVRFGPDGFLYLADAVSGRLFRLHQ